MGVPQVYQLQSQGVTGKIRALCPFVYQTTNAVGYFILKFHSGFQHACKTNVNGLSQHIKKVFPIPLSRNLTSFQPREKSKIDCALADPTPSVAKCLRKSLAGNSPRR